MIEVMLYHDREDYLCGYQFSGHAESAPYGEDLVCAAASTLAIVIENSLQVQGISYEAEIDEGYVKLMLSPIEDERNRLIAQAILKTLEVGVQALTTTYPQYIVVNCVLV